jgi:benzoate-CoA ligase
VLFAPLLSGAAAALIDVWPDPAVIAAAVERYRPTLVFSVPTMYRNLLEAGVISAPAFRQVRHYVSAGERLPEELWQRWKQATGVEILDGMGTSESIYMLLSNRPGEVRPGSSGKPVPGVECRLCDSEGAPVARGEPGILWAKVASRADRYWNAQAKSQAVFRGEWFRTGDIYAVDADGYWFHQGRADDMLKISGQWVSPAEIEEVALAQPMLSDACALGLPDADGLPRVALFVVPRAGGADELTLFENLRAAFKRELAPYKVPKWIRCVPEIPRTATGKLQRFRMRELYGATTSRERSIGVV